MHLVPAVVVKNISVAVVKHKYIIVFLLCFVFIWCSVKMCDIEKELNLLYLD